jgi:hypothetical protein
MRYQYPIGRYEPPAELNREARSLFIGQIADTPERLRAAVAGLTSRQLDAPYREGGWTVCQVVHHLADAHLNGYVRFKLALTEDEPTIRTYDQIRWAELGDARGVPIEPSLALLTGLHARWVAAIGTVEQEGFARRLHHPERGLMTVDDLLALYAWHGRHHVAHITSLRHRKGWR